LTCPYSPLGVTWNGVLVIGGITAGIITTADNGRESRGEPSPTRRPRERRTRHNVNEGAWSRMTSVLGAPGHDWQVSRSGAAAPPGGVGGTRGVEAKATCRTWQRPLLPTRCTLLPTLATQSDRSSLQPPCADYTVNTRSRLAGNEHEPLSL
jgi:hypothetical protein